jgi:hypothetical protein
MNTVENEIQKKIETFVKELDLLIRKSTLEALRNVLEAGGTSAPARGRARAPRAPAARPARRGRRPAAAVAAASETIAAHVRANDGQSVSEIASATRTALPVAKKALASLVRSGTVKKTGQKRGTRYHAGSGRARPAAVKKTAGRGKKRKVRGKA